MSKKIALVTGATRGIGLETVRQLAQQKVHVILAARDAIKGAAAVAKLKADGLDVEALTLDVTNAESIAAAVAAIGKLHGHLDILINNAGIMIDDQARKPSEQTLKIWRETFDTNVFGLIAVTQAFLPLLKKSAAGRIVNVSSLLGSISLHSDPTSVIYKYKGPASYNVSKSAVNAWTVQLAYELRETQVKVNAIHPGSVKTDMNSYGDIDVEKGAKSSVELALIGPDGPNGSFSHLGKNLPW